MSDATLNPPILALLLTLVEHLQEHWDISLNEQSDSLPFASPGSARVFLRRGGIFLGTIREEFEFSEASVWFSLFSCWFDRQGMRHGMTLTKTIPCGVL